MKRYAIVGPPNVGKSALFYALTGYYVKTANYPGTTLEIHKGVIRSGSEIVEIVDLPGVFNPDNPVDEDEKLALKEAVEGDYDGVVVVVAPHALNQGLRIAEIVSRHKPVVVVFNMSDIWRPPYTAEELSKKLSVPVVYAVATKREGIREVKELLIRGLPKSELRPTKLDVPPHVFARSAIFSRPALAALFLFGIGVATTLLLMALIEGVTPWGGQLPVSLSSLLDSLDTYVSDIVTNSVGGLLGRFIVEALWDSVLTLLSISVYVLIAFMLVIFYEDSGLIAQLSKAVERQLARIGVPPRGVVCLFISASCNVPGVTTAKVMWGSGSRVVTALLTPFIPCVARLAIFTAVATAALAKIPYLIPLAVFLPYAAAFIFAVTASFIYRKVLNIKGEAMGFVPPAPLMWPNLGIYMRKVAISFKEFISKAGVLIALVVIALWPLQAFGPGGLVDDVSQSYLGIMGMALQPIFEPIGLPWQVVVPLIGGWIFKEVVLGLLEATGGLDIVAGLPVPSIMAFLVFTAFYSACVATLSALYKIVGWRLTALSVVINLVLAYIASLATYAVFSLLP
ncbi:ferrous iron transporter B [Pyrobaculum sp. 3827-6]|uniref:ferrous iron transporter B n=1 Tax=Pyrobaculum sp. 3827-6 TaxID=2983604 RepID=UPI0021D90961|nr:ferrous iron transporter B [Pyrobaculum sp. 3827-6]MCU7787001.1 ferrous iron transporter B [Pyrobaculum sp. 3827-6]